jgi:methylglutaconyl-CoA hydratase
VSAPLLLSRRDGPVEFLTLNRPDVRNAFNDQLIAELTEWADRAASDPGLRVVVLAGAGPVFCAGADIGWLARTLTYTEEENLRDASAAARLFSALDRLPVPMVARVHGAAMGGGLGLIAVCDLAVAAETVTCGFSEVKLGILPAVISPYVIAKIGRSAARELFLTGMRFDAHRAWQAGLVHAVVPESDLDGRVRQYVGELLTAAPGAVADTKRLIAAVAGRPPDTVAGTTAAALAARRVSAEGQEGLRAFLDKRQPSWHVPPRPDR